MTRCATHKNARAAWICASCDKTLCPDCAFPRTINAKEVAICVHCGGLGKLITRPKRIAPFWEMFPKFLGAIFSGAGLIQIASIAIVQYLASKVPVIGGLIAFFIYVSYYFRVIASASAGAEKLPEPDDFLGFGSIVLPVFRFFLATTLIWLPATVYLIWGIGPEAIVEDPGAAFTSPVLILLLIAGILYFPAAIIAAAVAESALAVINPMITVRMILRIPGQYLLATAIWGVLTVVNFVVMNALEVASSAMSIPILTPILLGMIGLVVPVFTGFVLGRLIYQNHEDFGVMRLGDAEEPEWPDARPRAQADPRTHTRLGAGLDGSAPAKPVEAIEIDFTDEPPIPSSAPFQMFRQSEPPQLDPNALAPLELPPSDEEELSLDTGPLQLDLDGNLLRTGDLPPPSPNPPETLQLREEVPLLHIGKKRATGDLPAPPRQASAVRPTSVPPRLPDRGPPEDDVARLRTALDRGEEKLAYDLFCNLSGQTYPELDPRHNLRLAGVLERHNQFEEAVRACQRAAKSDMKGAFAPKAIFTAARIMADRSGNIVGARAMYEFLLKSFPTDELAIRAREALKRLT